MNKKMKKVVGVSLLMIPLFSVFVFSCVLNGFLNTIGVFGIVLGLAVLFGLSGYFGCQFLDEARED